MSGILLESNLKYIFGMLIYSLKHVHSYKYEKHLKEYDMKLQNMLHKGTVIGHLRQLLGMDVSAIL